MNHAMIGSSGLGAGYVQGFLDAGAYVTNLDLNPSPHHKDDSTKYVHLGNNPLDLFPLIV